jgi:uroporphyrinogen-III synthase
LKKYRWKKQNKKAFRLISFSFIETEAIQNIEIQQEIEWASVEEATVVFTSMNAVESVTGMLDGFVPEWRFIAWGIKQNNWLQNILVKKQLQTQQTMHQNSQMKIIENEEPKKLSFFLRQPAKR